MAGCCLYIPSLCADIKLSVCVFQGDAAQALGVCHSVHMLNSVVSRLEVIEPWSSPTVRVTDSALGGVPARVFQPVGGGAKLRRGVLYFHGGGWALGSGRKCVCARVSF